MTLTIGDLAALAAVSSIITGALAVVTRYYVKAEIEGAMNTLRLELVKERAAVLEARVVTTGHEQ